MADTSLANPLTLIGLDIGSSRIKIKTPDTQLAIASQVVRDAGHVSRADAQLKAAQRPTQIKIHDGVFLVGANAHAWGDRTEHHDILNTQRLLGENPKVPALFLGALTALIREHGLFKTSLAVCVGTPVGVDRAGRAQVEGWLTGTHTWQADGVTMTATVQHAHTIPQTSAAVFEYVLKDNGAKDKTLEPKPGQTLLAVSGGLWDLQIEGRTWDGKAWVEMPAVTHNWAYGSAELYRKFPKASLKTIGTMDQTHLAGGMGDDATREMWAGEVFELLDGVVGQWDAFDTVIPYGGFMMLPEIRSRFRQRLADNLVTLPDPVFAQASGMCKWLRAKYRQ